MHRIVPYIGDELLLGDSVYIIRDIRFYINKEHICLVENLTDPDHPTHEIPWFVLKHIVMKEN